MLPEWGAYFSTSGMEGMARGLVGQDVLDQYYEGSWISLVFEFIYAKVVYCKGVPNKIGADLSKYNKFKNFLEGENI